MRFVTTGVGTDGLSNVASVKSPAPGSPWESDSFPPDLGYELPNDVDFDATFVGLAPGSGSRQYVQFGVGYQRDVHVYANAAARRVNRVELGAEPEAVLSTATADEWESGLTAADAGCVGADRRGYRRFLYQGHAMARLHGAVARRAVAPQGNGGNYPRHASVVDFFETPCAVGLPYYGLGEQTQIPNRPRLRRR